MNEIGQYQRITNQDSAVRRDQPQGIKRAPNTHCDIGPIKKRIVHYQTQVTNTLKNLNLITNNEKMNHPTPPFTYRRTAVKYSTRFTGIN